MKRSASELPSAQSPPAQSFTSRRSLMDEFSELARESAPHLDRRRTARAGLLNTYAFGWPLGNSSVGQVLRDPQWTSSWLGSPPGWATWLRVAAGAMLELPLPAMLLVGPRHLQLYNDACVFALARLYPLQLGEPLEASSSRLWERNRAAVDTVLHSGTAIVLHGPLSGGEAAGDSGLAVTDTYSPVADEEGTTRAVLWLMPNRGLRAADA